MLRITDSVREIISPVLFYQLLLCAVSMSVFLLALEECEMLVFTLGITSITISTFIYCYLSDNGTADLFAIGDAFYGCAWYLLTVSQQKRLILPIQRANHEFRLTGFGIVDCSLGVFVSVSCLLSSFHCY